MMHTVNFDVDISHANSGVVFTSKNMTKHSDKRWKFLLDAK